MCLEVAPLVHVLLESDCAEVGYQHTSIIQLSLTLLLIPLLQCLQWRKVRRLYYHYYYCDFVTISIAIAIITVK